MFKVVEGDLFASGADVLAHGCNTYGSMGRGIAVAFRDRWPEMFRKYNLHCKRDPEDLHATCFLWENPEGPNVACLFTQHQWAAEPVYIEYALQDLAEQMGHKGTLALPAIGCGVAKTSQMNLDVLKEICEKVFGDSEIEATLYVPRI